MDRGSVNQISGTIFVVTDSFSGRYEEESARIQINLISPLNGPHPRGAIDVSLPFLMHFDPS